MPVTLLGNQCESLFQQVSRCIKIFSAAGGKRQTASIACLTFKTAQFLCQCKPAVECFICCLPFVKVKINFTLRAVEV